MRKLKIEKLSYDIYDEQSLKNNPDLNKQQRWTANINIEGKPVRISIIYIDGNLKVRYMPIGVMCRDNHLLHIDFNVLGEFPDKLYNEDLIPYTSSVLDLSSCKFEDTECRVETTEHHYSQEDIRNLFDKRLERAH